MKKRQNFGKKNIADSKKSTKKSTNKQQRTAEFPRIQEAVSRSIREYGEALKKLAKED